MGTFNGHDFPPEMFLAELQHAVLFRFFLLSTAFTTISFVMRRSWCVIPHDAVRAHAMPSTA